jgi:toxin CcdB
MAQWDVYPNPSARSRDEIPCLVDLQSDLLSGLATRMVAPLARTRVDAARLPRTLCPVFSIEAIARVLLPHEAGAVDARLLKGRVTSLRAHAHEIVGAMDAVIASV